MDVLQAVLSFVYAKCSIVDRRELWQQLHVLSQTISMPWMIGGDFNTILYANEKLGGNPPEVRSMDDFHEAISLANLIDAGFLGSKFTWCNNQEEQACIRAK